MRKVIKAGAAALVLLIQMSSCVRSQTPIDRKASNETRNLYKHLFRMQDQYILLGHQDDLAYGVGWKYIQGKSDIHSLTGQYPAVYGWDIGHLELDSARNLDGVPFAKMKEYIKEGYRRGGIITLSWHLNNPLNLQSAWDTTAGSVAAILPGRSKHAVYTKWLDKVAGFMQSLKGDSGEPIPILFRPFHELSGNWFWWCKNAAGTEDFKALWRFTVDYLKNKKNIHQLLYVYNTAGFATADEYRERYPGDDYADVLSFDRYQYNKADKEAYIKDVSTKLSLIQQLGKEKKKLTALAETGYEAIPDEKWWTATLWPAIQNTGISYVLLWRNHGYMATQNKMHYYAPFKGQLSANDFVQFCALPSVMLGNQLSAQKIYRK